MIIQTEIVMFIDWHVLCRISVTYFNISLAVLVLTGQFGEQTQMEETYIIR